MKSSPLHLHPGPSVLAGSGPEGAELIPQLEGLRVEIQPPVRARLTLFDSWSRDLWWANHLLVGDGTRLLALDREDPGCPGLEQPLRRPPTFAWELPEALRERIGDCLELRALGPVGILQVDQRIWEYKNSDDKVVARVLDQSWAEGPRTLQVLALRGYDAEAEALALALRLNNAPGAHPLREAIAAVLPPAWRWTSKPALGLSGEAEAHHAAQEALLLLLGMLEHVEPGLRADTDTEFLHDYRVLLRQARSVLSVMKGVFTPSDTQDLKAALRNLANRTNALRDLDVHLLEQEAQTARVPPELRPALDVLFEDVKRHRRREQRSLSRSLGKPDYREGIEALTARVRAAAPGRKANQSLRKMANKRIAVALETVLADGRAIHPDTPDAAIHELRIAAKKLRYTLELFREIYPPEAVAALIKPLKRLQDALGVFNDRSVQRADLRARAEEGRSRDPATLLAIGALIGDLYRDQQQMRIEILRCFAAFDSPDLPAAVKALRPRGGKGAS